MNIGEVFYFDETYANKAKWCNENGHHIEEVEADEIGRRFVIVENEKTPEEEVIRQKREVECFEFINRGRLWYDGLTAGQQEELSAWYQEWLDAPQTKSIPQKPSWLK